MAKRKLKILLLVDINFKPPEDHDYSEYLRTDVWTNEKHIFKALQRLGHDVKIFGVYQDIIPLIEEVKKNRPDLVFNSCEAFQDDRSMEPNIAGLVELLGVPITGTGSLGLQLCKDKGLTKKILSYHRIRVPNFEISNRKNPIRSLKNFPYPVFIKPLGAEASEGIAQMSFAETEKACIDRVKFIHESLEADAIIEEFIDGRELYVSIMGNSHLTVFPSREIFFSKIPDDEPKFASFKAKWDDAYRKKWGIRWGPAKKLPEETTKKIISTCKKIYKLFHLKGYGRIDLRIKDEKDVVFLEANPNPSLSQDDDFPSSARLAGISFDKMIERIVHLATL